MKRLDGSIAFFEQHQCALAPLPSRQASTVGLLLMWRRHIISRRWLRRARCQSQASGF